MKRVRKGKESALERLEAIKEQARRDRALGIKRERWHVMFDTAALQSIDEYWATFKKVLGGREPATDYLIVLMRYGYETLERVTKEKALVGNKKRRRSDPTGPTL